MAKKNTVAVAAPVTVETTNAQVPAVTLDQLKGQMAALQEQLKAARSEQVGRYDETRYLEISWYVAGSLRKATDEDKVSFAKRERKCPEVVVTLSCTKCGTQHTRGTGDAFHCTKCPACKGGGSAEEKVKRQIAKLQEKLTGLKK
jgi:hypothetical protein